MIFRPKYGRPCIEKPVGIETSTGSRLVFIPAASTSTSFHHPFDVKAMFWGIGAASDFVDRMVFWIWFVRQAVTDQYISVNRVNIGYEAECRYVIRLHRASPSKASYASVTDFSCGNHILSMQNLWNSLFVHLIDTPKFPSFGRHVI